MTKIEAIAPNFAKFANANWTEVPLWRVLELKKEIVGEDWTDYTLLSLTKRGVIIRDLSDSKGKFPESFEGYQRLEENDFIFCLFDVQETPRTVGVAKTLGMITSAYTRMVVISEEVNPQYLERLLLSIDDFKRFQPFYSGLRNTIQKETFLSTRIALPPLDEQLRIVEYLDSELAEIDELIAKQFELIETLEKRKTSVVVETTTRGLNPSSEMADSHVPWVDEHPSHWQVAPLFSVSSESKISNTGLTETNLLSLSYGRVVTKDIETNEGLLPESFEGYQIVNSGDIVFRFTDLQNDKKSLRTGLVEERGIITNAYLAISIHGQNSKYMNYLMRAYDLCKVFYSMGGGLRQSLAYSDVRFLPILLPPISEQVEIAEYLDGEIIEIDALLLNCKSMISKLQLRKSILNEAVVFGQIPVGQIGAA